MKLWLDDIRLAPSMEWKRVMTYAEFVEAIEIFGLPEIVSFDHDLGDWTIVAQRPVLPDYEEKTGYDCAKWLINYCLCRDIDLPEWRVHSANPVGAENIRALLENYTKFRHSSH